MVQYKRERERGGKREKEGNVCERKKWEVSFSMTGSGLYINNFSAWSKPNLLHSSQWVTFPTQACLILYSFCASLLHSLIMWLTVSFLSLHSLHWRPGNYKSLCSSFHLFTFLLYRIPECSIHSNSFALRGYQLTDIHIKMIRSTVSCPSVG